MDHRINKTLQIEREKQEAMERAAAQRKQKEVQDFKALIHAAERFDEVTKLRNYVRAVKIRQTCWMSRPGSGSCGQSKRSTGWILCWTPLTKSSRIMTWHTIKNGKNGAYKAPSSMKE